MKQIHRIICIAALLLIVQNIFGQKTGTTVSSSDNPVSTGTYDKYGDSGKTNGGPMGGAFDKPSLEMKARLKRLKEVESVKTLTPPPPPLYYTQYKFLLKNGKYKLIRIFPDENCDNGKVVSVQRLERCENAVPIKGSAAFYSFDDHANIYNGELHFVNNKLQIGNETVQGIMTGIENINLEDVNLKSPQLKNLTSYKPKDSLTEIKEQNKILEKGISLNGFTYTNSVLAGPDQIYAFRTVIYRMKNRTEADKYYQVGRDMIIVFKIVGQESDGSLIIIWKKLRDEAPLKVLKD